MFKKINRRTLFPNVAGQNFLFAFPATAKQKSIAYLKRTATSKQNVIKWFKCNAIGLFGD